MSLVPVIDGSPWQGLPGPQHLFDQHFGMGVDLGDLVAPAPTQLRPGNYRSWRYASHQKVGKGTVDIDKDGFHVMMDVQHFTPEDITVKHQVNHVLVEGKHHEMPDAHGYISRLFVRRYILPKTVNGDALQSTISSDGVLMVTAPKLPALEEGTARTIPKKMSLVPVFDGYPWQGIPGSLHMFDQHFGMGVDLGDLVAPAPSHTRPGYNRPWHYASPHHVGKGTVTVDKDGFHVMMDILQFPPEDITVKHQGNHVVVEGKHEETLDAHGYISRHFVRRYVLPKTVNGDALQSTISSDGVLTVTAPRMSLVPVFGGSPWKGLPGSLHLFDQNFGMGLDMDDLIAPAPTHFQPGYYRPWRYGHTNHGGKSTVTVDKDRFHVMMDVQHFTPEEITVKHQGNHVVVEGKHEETPDAHGYISRHFVRCYVLPKTVNGDALQSTISSDGVLTVTAPKLPALGEETARAIPIIHTGMPAIMTKSHMMEKHIETERPKK